MKVTIKPGHYGRIAHQHQRIAMTAKAIGDDATAQAEMRKRDVTINRARCVKAALQENSNETAGNS